MSASHSSANAGSPNLLDVKFGSVLFLGGSGSGKTYGLKSVVRQLLCQQKKTILYSINVKDSEYTKEFSKRHCPIQFDKINNIKRGSVVVIEDIIDLKTKEEIALRQLLNWHAHHKSLKVFCISHNIFKTKLYSTVAHFNYVVFTSSLSNLFVIGKCLGYFQLEPEIIENLLQKIKWFKGTKGVFFYLQTSNRNFNTTNNLVDSNSTKILALGDAQISDKVEKEKKKLALQQRFELFFKGQKRAHQAGAVFSIINECVDPSLIVLTDLTLKFKTVKGVRKNVSLVDYVNSLLTEKSINQQNENEEYLVCHRFIQAHCNIPKIFLLNKNYD